MLTNTDQGGLRGHGRRKDFFKEGAPGDFSKIFLGDAKSGKICFFSFKTTKKNFVKIFKIQGVSRPSLPFRRPCTWTQQHG